MNPNKKKKEPPQSRHDENVTGSESGIQSNGQFGIFNISRKGTMMGGIFRVHINHPFPSAIKHNHMQGTLCSF